MIPTHSEYRSAWFSLYLSAVHTNRSPEGAAQFADEAIKIYADRYELLGKWEAERDRALERLRLRSRQVEVSVQAFMLLAAIRTYAKDLPYDDRLVRLMQNYSADRIACQLHEVANRFVIVPQELAVPKEDETDNPLFFGREE